MSFQPQFTSEDVLVRMQPTPNPYALKFIANHAFKSQGKVTLNDPLDCPDSPLIKDVFGVLGVKQLFLSQNTMTVTHSGEMSNDTLEDAIEVVIKTRLPVHNPHFETGNQESKVTSPKKVDRSHLSEDLRHIEEIMDRTIRPGLQADGGDLEVLEFKDNTVKILYMGACGGCPSAMMGTLDAIQNILRNELKNETLIVRPV